MPKAEFLCMYLVGRQFAACEVQCIACVHHEQIRKTTPKESPGTMPIGIPIDDENGDQHGVE